MNDVWEVQDFQVVRVDKNTFSLISKEVFWENRKSETE
jgi:hypothetical protein